jgi:diadenosine tetraphosphate (Ap4A) HIT family hydrolase
VTAADACPLCTVDANDATVVFADERWLVRSVSATPAVAGWLILQARRHIADVSELDADEAATFGPMTQRFAHLLREFVR